MPIKHLLLLFFILIFCFTLSAFAPLPDATLEARAIALEKNLRCPVCQGEPLSESQSQIADAMRSFIRKSLAQGQDEIAIKALLEKQYGTDLSLSPPLNSKTLILWAWPLIALIFGAWLLWKQRQKVD